MIKHCESCAHGNTYCAHNDVFAYRLDGIHHLSINGAGSCERASELARHPKVKEMINSVRGRPGKSITRTFAATDLWPQVTVDIHEGK